MGLLGNGEGYTVLILTDEESRLIRTLLEISPGPLDSPRGLAAFNRGIQRGTERLKAEFKGK